MEGGGVVWVGGGVEHQGGKGNISLGRRVGGGGVAFQKKIKTKKAVDRSHSSKGCYNLRGIPICPSPFRKMIIKINMHFIGVDS